LNFFSNKDGIGWKFPLFNPPLKHHISLDMIYRTFIPSCPKLWQIICLSLFTSSQIILILFKIIKKVLKFHVVWFYLRAQKLSDLFSGPVNEMQWKLLGDFRDCCQRIHK
jgi:hypothetical protein